MGERFTTKPTDGDWTVVDHADRYAVHDRPWSEELAQEIAAGLNAGNLHEITFTWEVES